MKPAGPGLERSKGSISVPLVAALLIGSLLLFSAFALIVELRGFGARNNARILLEGDTPIADAELEEALALLDQKWASGGSDPANSTLRGLLYSYQALSPAQSDSADNTETAASWQASLEALREAIQGQPTWPYNWMYLAERKLAAGELDEEFRHAFQQSIRLGGQEPIIQEAVLQILVQSWPFLAGDPVIEEKFGN